MNLIKTLLNTGFLVLLLCIAPARAMVFGDLIDRLWAHAHRWTAIEQDQPDDKYKGYKAMTSDLQAWGEHNPSMRDLYLEVLEGINPKSADEHADKWLTREGMAKAEKLYNGTRSAFIRWVDDWRAKPTSMKDGLQSVINNLVLSTEGFYPCAFDSLSTHLVTAAELVRSYDPDRANRLIVKGRKFLAEKRESRWELAKQRLDEEEATAKKEAEERKEAEALIRQRAALEEQRAAARNKDLRPVFAHPTSSQDEAQFKRWLDRQFDLTGTRTLGDTVPSRGTPRIRPTLLSDGEGGALAVPDKIIEGLLIMERRNAGGKGKSKLRHRTSAVRSDK